MTCLIIQHVITEMVWWTSQSTVTLSCLAYWCARGNILLQYLTPTSCSPFPSHFWLYFLWTEAPQFRRMSAISVHVRSRYDCTTFWWGTSNLFPTWRTQCVCDCEWASERVRERKIRGERERVKEGVTVCVGVLLGSGSARVTSGKDCVILVRRTGQKKMISMMLHPSLPL